MKLFPAARPTGVEKAAFRQESRSLRFVHGSKFRHIAKKRLLPPRIKVSCCFRMHPSYLARFVANQDIEKGTHRHRNAFLRKQRRDPLLCCP